MLEPYYVEAKNKISYGHSIEDNPAVRVDTSFHLHDKYEIYFFIAGNVNYFIEKKVYSLQYGDLFIINSHEIHKPTFVTHDVYERIVIHFDPTLPRLFNSPGFDLLHCFTARPKGEQNKINLDKNQVEEILKIFNRIELAARSEGDGSDVLKLTYFIELLVFINRAFLSIKPSQEHSNVPEKLVPILDYIDENLDGNLTLETLEQRFYLDRFYLSHLFKRSTGINIHEYIIVKRISLAKKLLSEGCSVTDTCQASGFNDYSNFIRIFKKTVGVPPGQFKKKHAI